MNGKMICGTPARAVCAVVPAPPWWPIAAHRAKSWPCGSAPATCTSGPANGANRSPCTISRTFTRAAASTTARSSVESGGTGIDPKPTKIGGGPAARNAWVASLSGSGSGKKNAPT